MNDVTDLVLGALSVVLCGAAFAVGGQVIRDAWRGAFHGASTGPPAGTAPEQVQTPADGPADLTEPVDRKSRHSKPDNRKPRP